MKLLKWQSAYMEEIQKMNLKELIDEVIDLSNDCASDMTFSGDHCYWKYGVAYKHVMDRLSKLDDALSTLERY